MMPTLLKPLRGAFIIAWGALVLSAAAGPLATIGGRLAYSPLVPMPDPLANMRAEANGKPVCVTAPPAARDCALRFIADSTPGRALLARLLNHFGSAWTQASAEQIALAAVAPPTPATPSTVAASPTPKTAQRPGPLTRNRAGGRVELAAEMSR